MREGVVFESDELNHAITGAGYGVHARAPGLETAIGCLLDGRQAEHLRVGSQIRKKIAHLVLIRSDTISPLPTVKAALFFESFRSPVTIAS